MKPKKLTVPAWLVAPVLYGIVRTLYATLRFTEQGRETVDDLDARGEPMVFALWHDELFPVVHAKRNLGLVAVISQSSDGEYLSQFMEMFGVRTARGSSSRGGVKALLQVSRMLRKEGLHACLTVDGPRGPRHKAKEGAAFIAARANARIVPIRLHMDRSYKFERAWDKFQIPLPFSRVHVVFGEPYHLPEGEMDKEFLEQASRDLEARLNTL
ncbi:lysophospholipid acyltransferase family protein [Desulfovibrio psychrotolerans]|uniref:DUF374 domain-containing protein n=1 Tax=Desulfovibrio psychrotolerans TaxID=415242 RepID=A0A7J0BPB1_9BACT|nr:lysophospholipid acyltransferase family protein [Desulfovibrio psychrotolerans]GFM35480.1 hypothetical protein DSM19430T_01640 [Desulfovibrio psychrotolerans]